MSDAPAATQRWLAAGNPWWVRDRMPLPHFSPPSPAAQAVLAVLQRPERADIAVLDGARQTGKSALLAALAAGALARALPPTRLCRIALEHGALRWQEAAALVEAWQQQSGASGSGQQLLVDDFHLWPAAEQDSLAQLALDPDRQVVVAGVDLADCVERWRAAGLRVSACRLAPALFDCADPAAATLPPAPRSLRELFDWPAERFASLAPAVGALQAGFLRYLAHGGYPAPAAAPDAAAAQALLREQVVMRSLRWDAAGRHGVRRVDQLERTLFLAAAGSGSLLDMPRLCQQLDVERPTVRHFLDLLVQAGLLLRVPPLGYGQAVQRARPLLSLGDPGLLAALRARQDTGADEAQAQCALALHLQRAYGERGGRLCTVAAGRQGHAPVLAVQAGDSVLPFGLRWHDTADSDRALALAALSNWCSHAGVARAYVATRHAHDFGPLPPSRGSPVALMRVPVALLCHWLVAAAAGPNGSGEPAGSATA